MIGGNLEQEELLRTNPSEPDEDNPDLRLKLGIMLGHVRREQGVSQEKAAKINRVSRPHLSNIEQGRARTNWKALEKMAHFYTVGIQELILRAERELPDLPGQSKTGLVTPHHGRSLQMRWNVDTNVGHILRDEETRWLVDNYRALAPESRTTVRKLMIKLNAEAESKLGKP